MGHGGGQAGRRRILTVVSVTLRCVALSELSRLKRDEENEPYLIKRILIVIIIVLLKLVVSNLGVVLESFTREVVDGAGDDLVEDANKDARESV